MRLFLILTMLFLGLTFSFHEIGCGGINLLNLECQQ